MLRATWYEGTAQLLSLTELRSHLFELYFIGWTIKLMKQPTNKQTLSLSSPNLPPPPTFLPPSPSFRPQTTTQSDLLDVGVVDVGKELCVILQPVQWNNVVDVCGGHCRQMLTQVTVDWVHVLHHRLLVGAQPFAHDVPASFIASSVYLSCSNRMSTISSCCWVLGAVSDYAL